MPTRSSAKAEKETDMIIYLTNDPIDIKTAALQAANGFSELFCADAASLQRALYIGADPQKTEENDAMAKQILSAMQKTGLHISVCSVLDERTKADAEALVASAELIVLGDGDVCTQHAFLEEIGLGALLALHAGVLLCIGSGAVCASFDVYVQPEGKGAATDLLYKKHLYGLGLTRVSVVPHFCMGSQQAAMARSIEPERITYRGERAHMLYAIPKGTFILCQDGNAVMFGEGYLIEDEYAIRYCRENECRRMD